MGLRDADDLEIWTYAETEATVFVTKDEDFVAMAGRLPSALQVLWVGTGNTLTPSLLMRFEAAWPSVEPLLANGHRLIALR